LSRLRIGFIAVAPHHRLGGEEDFSLWQHSTANHAFHIYEPGYAPSPRSVNAQAPRTALNGSSTSVTLASRPAITTGPREP
jgi:hypothetical protein